MSKNIEQISWKEFQSSGMLWFINKTLHLFGLVIVVEIDNNIVTKAYPARTKYRGFSKEDNDEGYKKVTEYMDRNSYKLLKVFDE